MKNNTFFSNEILYITHEIHKNPWVIIYTHKVFKEFSDLDDTTKDEVMKFVLEIERAMREFFNPIKINHAVFGNVLPIFHYHIQARFSEDEFYPEPLWGKKSREWGGISDEKMKEFINFLTQRLDRIS